MTDHSPADAGGPASGPPPSSLPSPYSHPTSPQFPPPPPPPTNMAPPYPVTQVAAWQEVYNVRPDAPLSTVSLVLGIIGLIPYPLFFLLAPVALITSLVGKSKVKAFPPGTYRTGKLTAGLVMGIIGTTLLVALIVLFALLFALMWVMSEPNAT